MATPNQAPLFVRVSNTLTVTLLRAGVKLFGPGHYPMYLLTVRGRKSELPRTVPIVMWEHDGKRYVGSVYGIGDACEVPLGDTAARSSQPGLGAQPPQRKEGMGPPFMNTSMRCSKRIVRP